MPDRQKYALRMALAGANAAEGVTYMDLKAVKEEMKRAREDGDDAELDFISEDGSPVKVLVRAADIQLTMHHEWRRPAPQQVVPATAMPRPRLEQ
jgi:hypothetical protein